MPSTVAGGAGRGWRRPGRRYRQLGDEDFAWTTNQVFEKTDVTYDGALTNPCRLDRDLIGASGRILVSRDSEFVGHFETPLQTKWVAIKFRFAAQGVTIQVDGDSVAFTVYWADDPRSCVDIPDGDGWFGSLPAGAEVLVLVANRSFSTGRVQGLRGRRVKRTWHVLPPTERYLRRLAREP